MSRSSNWFKKNLAYGLVVVVPVAILLLLLAKVVEVLQTIAAKLQLGLLVGAKTETLSYEFLDVPAPR